jgi:hypothetical protein
MAARALPFILGGWVLYLALLHRPRLRRNWRGLALALLVAAVVAAPLALWLLTHPDAEYRVGEVSEPLDRLLAGDPGLVADNAVALLKMWSLEGDPWDRQNLPGRPVFVEPLGALLFYAGLLIALWRVRQPAYAFVMIWLAGSLIPSLVTSVAPSSIRTINALGVVYVFPALAVQEAAARLRTPKTKALVGAVVGLVLVWNLYLTARDYFARWPDDAGVQFVFQSGLTEIARDLDADADDSPVAVAGLSVDTMDPPTFAVSLRRRDLALRWFDPREALVVPGGGSPARLYVPRIVPMAAPLQAQLAAWGAARIESEQYVRYELLDGAQVRSHLPSLETPEVTFGGRVALLDYEWVTSPVSPGRAAELLTYWRVLVTPQPPLKIFLHLVPVGGEGALAQNDGLGSPPDTWQSGDVVVRWHRIELPSDLAPGLYQPQVGWYNPETSERLRLEGDGTPFADRLPLTPMEVSQE